MKVFSQSMSIIENAIQQTSTKQKVISQNIANVDTPGYKTKDVSFKSAFDSALSNMNTYKTDERHFDFTPSNLNTTVLTKKNVTYNESGNSVDMDQEMSELAANQIQYNALVDRMSSKFNGLENVIKGGR